jgi:hypothetical protein
VNGEHVHATCGRVVTKTESLWRCTFCGRDWYPWILKTWGPELFAHHFATPRLVLVWKEHERRRFTCLVPETEAQGLERVRT